MFEHIEAMLVMLQQRMTGGTADFERVKILSYLDTSLCPRRKCLSVLYVQSFINTFF